MTKKFNGFVAAGVSVLLAASAMAASPSSFRTHSPVALADDTDSLVASDGKANVIVIFKQQPGALAYSKALHQAGSGAMAETAANSAAKAAVNAAVVQQNAAAALLKRSGIDY